VTRHTDPEEFAAELRRRLIDEGAIPRDLAPLPGQETRAEEALARIVSSPPLGPPYLRTKPGLRRRRRALAFLGAAVAIVLGLAIVWPGWPGSTPHAVAATPPLLAFPDVATGRFPEDGEPARERLLQLAAAVERQPDPAPEPVQRVVVSAWFTSSEETADGSMSSSLAAVTRESNFAPDGTMYVVESRGPELDQHGRVKDPANESEAPVTVEESFESNDPGPRFAEELSADPRRLREQLDARQDPQTCGAVPASCLVVETIDLFHNYVVRPGLSAALWRTLATEPGVTYVGEVSDRLDRPADAFAALGLDRTTHLLIFLDPETGLYLGDEEVLTEPSDAFGFDPPAVISFSALVESRRVPSASG